MNYAEKLKTGISTSFFGRLDRKDLDAVAAAGIDCVELSYGFDHYMNVIEFPQTAAYWGRQARDTGVEIWSLHLPFSGTFDISSERLEFRSITSYVQRELIWAAAEAGASVVVLHPSAEPIADDKRQEHFQYSRENIEKLAREADACGLILAVENLPRTCLCRNSEEMIALLKDTGADAVFDTNHNLSEDNVCFVDALTAGGVRIASLHISDYGPDENGVLDERHRMPGDGINRWNDLLAALERHGYTGPLMYEISHQPKNREAYTLEDAAANMRALAGGQL